MTNTIPSKEELNTLADYLQRVADAIPDGLRDLRDVVSFVTFDIRMYSQMGTKSKSFEKALAFATTVPRVEDVEDDKLTCWMLEDEEFRKYF
ncbi:hypothetical protein LX64_05181 [Chitinophaga skermanii]|uniref:Uncharacterized protein n=1 Tax=Chitinophaga skermanii TaxID=331697 RepID=A0A327PZT2_9BACT|nr:hypothetical protein [Chitinophaga skermanii]RAI96981.1 hypothetical protein LX64_05181 [Chitinophaga skermanii]